MVNFWHSCLSARTQEVRGVARFPDLKWHMLPVPSLCPCHTYSKELATITQARLWASSFFSLMSSRDNLVFMVWFNTLCHKHYKQTTVYRMDVPEPDSAPKIHRILHQPPVLYSSDRNLIQAGS